MKAKFCKQIAGIFVIAFTSPAFAVDFYWSGSGSSDDISQGGNWHSGSNPSSGDNLYFNNTVNRHWAYSNYGTGSWFGNIVTYNGAGGIKWRGNTTWAYKFENYNDANLFEIEASIGNRTGSDVEINPVGSGGIKITGSVSITDSKQIKVYGGNTLTFEGAVSGSGASLDIIGPATVVMATSNSYTGGTTISSGTLVVNGSLATAGNVTVHGKLAGIGTIGGATTIKSTGTHSPTGTTQTFGSSLKYESGSIFEWDISTSTGAYDKVSVGTTLDVTSGAVFKVFSTAEFSDAFWNTDRTWNDIFGGKNLANFLVSNFQYIANGSPVVAPAAEGYFSVSGSTLSWTAVPEPTSALAGLLLGAGLLRRKRR